MDFISEIINLMHEEGLEVNYNGSDLDLRDYIFDSIQFISFIVEIEKIFYIEIPDEYLLYDSISSLYSFAKIIKNCKEINTEAYND